MISISEVRSHLFMTCAQSGQHTCGRNNIHPARPLHGDVSQYRRKQPDPELWGWPRTSLILDISCARTIRGSEGDWPAVIDEGVLVCSYCLSVSLSLQLPHSTTVRMFETRSGRSFSMQGQEFGNANIELKVISGQIN